MSKPARAAAAAPHDLDPHGYAEALARAGATDEGIAAALGGSAGKRLVKARAADLAAERERGCAELLVALHGLALAGNVPAVLFAIRARLRWSDNLPAANLPPPQPIVISIPGLTTQEPPP